MKPGLPETWLYHEQNVHWDVLTKRPGAESTSVRPELDRRTGRSVSVEDASENVRTGRSVLVEDASENVRTGRSVSIEDDSENVRTGISV